MRAWPLLAAILLLPLPAAKADPGALSLTGPGELADGATSAFLRVALELENVVCTRETEIPVTLSVARSQNARGALSTERVVFRLPAQGAVAREWTANGAATLAIEPLGATGLVEVVARYELPAHCASASGERAGEARHVVRSPAAPAADAREPAPAPSLRALPPPASDGEPLPLGLLAAAALTCAAGLAVVVKRLRASFA